MDKAGSLPSKDKEAIAVMHGMPKETDFSQAGEKAFRFMESLENMAIEEIVSIALQALGIKARPDAP